MGKKDGFFNNFYYGSLSFATFYTSRIFENGSPSLLELLRELVAPHHQTIACEVDYRFV